MGPLSHRYQCFWRHTVGRASLLRLVHLLGLQELRERSPAMESIQDLSRGRPGRASPGEGRGGDEEGRDEETAEELRLYGLVVSFLDHVWSLPLV